jgi:hypothetical protein
MISFGGFESSIKYNSNGDKDSQFEEDKHEDSSPLDSPPLVRAFPSMGLDSPFQLTLGIFIIIVIIINKH